MQQTRLLNKSRTRIHDERAASASFATVKPLTQLWTQPDSKLPPAFTSDLGSSQFRIVCSVEGEDDSQEEAGATWYLVNEGQQLLYLQAQDVTSHPVVQSCQGPAS